MTDMAPTFELVLTGNTDPHQFTAFMPDGEGGRTAEHTFAWRTDSSALAVDLGALARAAISGPTAGGRPAGHLWPVTVRHGLRWRGGRAVGSAPGR